MSAELIEALREVKRIERECVLLPDDVRERALIYADALTRINAVVSKALLEAVA